VNWLPETMVRAAGLPAGTVLLAGLWCAWLLDLLLGDPRRLPHPVMLIALLARFWKRVMQGTWLSPLVSGCLTVLFTLLSSLLAGLIFLRGPLRLLSAWEWIGPVYLLYTSLALRSLTEHGLAVFRALETDDLAGAREKVGWMVSRRTADMNREAVVRACVESVAENMSDGVIAPLGSACLGGSLGLLLAGADQALAAAALAALLYKTVNTLDSLFGYTDDRYLFFGRCAARLDDLANWPFARSCGLLIVLAAAAVGKNSGRAWQVMVRDARKHQSPNSGWPEAAMAGALGIRLGGPGNYAGRIMNKPTLGDAEEAPGSHHVRQAVKIMQVGCWLALGLFSLVFFLFS